MNRGGVPTPDAVHQHVAAPLQVAARACNVGIDPRQFLRRVVRLEDELEQLLRQALAEPRLGAVDVAELDRARVPNILAVAELQAALARAAAGGGRGGEEGERREC